MPDGGGEVSTMIKIDPADVPVLRRALRAAIAHSAHASVYLKDAPLWRKLYEKLGGVKRD